MSLPSTNLPLSDLSTQNGSLSTDLYGSSHNNIVSEYNINPLSLSGSGYPSFNKENPVFEEFYPQSDKIISNNENQFGFG